MQIQPPRHLSPYIRHYIFLENAGSERKSLRLFTDGSTGLILSGSQNLYANPGHHIPSSFFMDSRQDIKILWPKVHFLC
ncbi:hypothetical protein EG345_10375 [Chryseobacterium carnipullorum]|uniref:DUF6597 domain-containing transcriptional factor n=1 Tax=Chryseobacterium carnipullorum TaxID=1124835 RepID=UPI000F71B4CA|nr:hypothetical protein EG345_10375 [Chryseobacterium carnipullorum]